MRSIASLSSLTILVLPCRAGHRAPLLLKEATNTRGLPGGRSGPMLPWQTWNTAWNRKRREEVWWRKT
eukprot:12891201-Prorocentrum_lima.AAC.1